MATVRGQGARMGGGAWLVLGLLLVAPGYALSRLTPWVEPWVLVGAPLAMSLVTFLMYRSDKRRAEAGEWRTPESALHALELAGGWPGAFVAQRWLRHKNAKASFQFVFWSIVAIHQFAAVDGVLGWELTRGLVREVTALVTK
jgi:uncharacterized membrane protein YsdA (DUF1294 family)